MIRVTTYRPARSDDVEAIAKPLLDAGIFSRVEQLVAQIDERPWTIQVNDRRPGKECAVVDVWRRWSGVAIIRHLSAEPRKRQRLVAHLLGVLSEQGFSSALSPLLDNASRRAFSKTGFTERERLVVLKKQGLRFRPVEPACDVRRMSPDDAEAIAAVDESCFDGLWRFGPDDVTAMMPDMTGFVAVQDGRSIGYNMVSISREAGTVGRLAVSPQFRNRGVGSTLLAAGLEWLAEAGGTEVTLCTQHGNTASRRLYRRFGFEQLPENLSLMQKNL